MNDIVYSEDRLERVCRALCCQDKCCTPKSCQATKDNERVRAAIRAIAATGIAEIIEERDDLQRQIADAVDVINKHGGIITGRDG